MNRAAHALADRGLAQGRPARAAVAQLAGSSPSSTFATARLGVVLVPVNFMLGAPTRSRYILEHSGASGMVAEDALAADRGEGAGRGGVARRRRAAGSALSGAAPGAGLGGRRRLVAATARADAPDVPVGDDDPMRLMYTSRHRVAAEGRDAVEPALIAQYVSCVDRRRDERRRRRAARPAAVPLRAAGLLLLRRRLPRRDQHHPARPRPGRDAARRSSRERVTKLFCPPTVWISLLRHPDFDTHRPVVAAQGLLRRLGHAGRGAARSCSGGCPTSRCGTSTARPRWRRWPRSCGPRSSCRRPARPAGAALNVETRLVDDDGKPVPPGEVGEIVHRSPHADAGLLRRRGEDGRGVPGGWFHSGDLGRHDEDGYLSVVDRKKDMIKTGGENVASREVEEAIYALDGVAEVAVFGISHPHWIEAVTAVVVPKAGATLTAEDVAGPRPRDARRLQAAQVRRHRRRAAEEPQRQDPQARAAVDLRRAAGSGT